MLRQNYRHLGYRWLFGTWVIAGCLALGLFQNANANLINGGFEDPDFGPGPQFDLVHESTVPGWETTATDGRIEIWSNNFGSVPAYEGNQHAELNANQVSTLFQDLSGVAANSTLGWQFAHRGRQGVDTMKFELTDLGVDNMLGGGDDATLFMQTVSDGNGAWGFYPGSGSLALGNTIRLSFTSISSEGGAAIGNFLDDVNLFVAAPPPPPPPAPAPGPLAVPEPTSFALFTVVGVVLGCVAAWRTKWKGVGGLFSC